MDFSVTSVNVILCKYFKIFWNLHFCQVKGIVHLNIIFSYVKFNKICNLDHPVY